MLATSASMTTVICRASPSPRDLQNPVEVERGFEMIGEPVEDALDLGLIGEALRTRKAELGEEAAAEFVAREEAVQIAAGDQPVGGARPLAAVRRGEIGPRAIGPV